MKVPFLCCAAIAATAFFASAASADSPQNFVRNAMRGDMGEISLGHAAQSHGGSQQVRDFGRTLSDDHTRARGEFLAIAHDMRIPVDSQLPAEVNRERQRLVSMNGRDFDREFIRFMVDEHRKDISEYRDEARENHGRVSALAGRQLPTLQKHLDIALSIQARLEDRVANGNDRGRFNRDHNGRDNNGQWRPR